MVKTAIWVSVVLGLLAPVSYRVCRLLDNTNRAVYNLSAASYSLNKFVTRVDTASAPVLECKGHGTCLPAQILATAGSVKAMAGAYAKAAPRIVENLQQVSNGVVKSSDNVEKLTRNLSAAAGEVKAQVPVIAGAVTGLREDAQPTLAASSILVKNLDGDLSRLTAPAEDTLFAARDASRTFSTYLPKFQQRVDFLAQKGGETADHIAKITQPHWYDRLIGYSLDGLMGFHYLLPQTPIQVLYQRKTK